MTTNKCRTFLISDNPSEKDEFGSHKKLADAVSELIISESEGGKTIGIEGDWGSGKSTVVNLINANLCQSDQNLIFLFDAWAHHDDPLRRTFLESLIFQAEEKGWIKDKESKQTWNKVKAVLAQRVKIESKTTHPKLKLWARFLLLSILLLPLGTIFINSGLENSSQKNIFYNFQLFIGSLCLIAPFTIVILVLVNNIFKKSKGETQENIDEPLSFLSQNFTPDTVTETYQTINPTSIEFENTFSELVTEITSNSDRKVIIVLDNLDRIDAGEALSLLSTLQTFLQHSRQKTNWLKRLWIIIPYDRYGLEKLWKKDQYSKVINKEEGIEDDLQDSEIATSFLDKRFQIRFEVPPIVLSNWSAYLKKLLQDSFPDHPKDEFHDAYRVFELYRSDPISSPTPREIKLYVNQIGAIHRQWQDTFPLSHVGYYVLLKRKGQDVIKELRSGRYNDPNLLSVIGSELIDNLTALSFNVEITLARQLLLRRPIIQALNEGDEESFLGLADHPGFLQVLENINFSSLRDSGILNLTNAASVLCGENGNKLLDVNTRKSIVAEFRLALSNAKTWTPFNRKTASGIANIFEFINAGDELIRKTIKLVSDTLLSTLIEKEKSEEKIIEWVDGVIILLNTLASNRNVDEIFPDKIILSCSGKDYIDVCGYLYKQDLNGDHWNLFTPEKTSNEIILALNDLVRQDEINVHHVNAIKVITRQNININWDSLINELFNRIQVASNFAPELIKTRYAMLWQLKGESQFNQIIINLAQSGMDFYHLNSAQQNPLSSAYCIFSYFSAYPDGRVVNQIGESERGRAFLTQILSSPDSYNEITDCYVKLLDQYGEYDLPFQMLSNTNSRNWVAKLLKTAVAYSDSVKYFSPDNVLQQWSFINDSIGSEIFDGLIEKMILETDILQKITGGEFSATQAGLYAKLIRAGASKDQIFRDWCITNIKEIGPEEMQIHINKEDHVAELIIDLVDNDVIFDLGIAYQEIIFNHAIALMKGELQSGYLRELWNSLLMPLSPHARDTLRDRLVEPVIQREGNISQDFFVIYGDELIETKGIEKSRGLVLHALTPLIKNRHFTGTKWIVKLLEAKPTMLTNYPQKNHVDDMHDWIDKALESNVEDEARESIIKIAEFFDKTQKKKGQSESPKDEENIKA
jgi:hypothetical protein